MKSLMKLTLLCLLSVVALNESKADEVTTQTNGNEVTVKTTETESFKKNETRGFVGATISTSGFVGAKAGLEFNKNLNAQNAIFVGIEGTYYLPFVENKFYNMVKDNLSDEQDAYDLMFKYNNQEQLFTDYVAISEKYQGSLTLGITMKFLNAFAISPYLVGSVSYGTMAYNNGNMTENVHEYEESFGYGTWHHTEYSYTPEVETKQRLFYKGGAGVKFTFGNRVFADLRYQITSLNIKRDGMYNEVLGGRNQTILVHELSASAGVYLF